MKCTESRELRDLSMNQLNAKLSELYKELPSRKWAFQRKSIKVSKEKAIIIASNHNNIPIEKAKEYTDSELREVLRHLNLKPGF